MDTIHVSLISESPNILSQMLPFLSALFGVIVGGLVSYFSNNQLHKQQRQSEISIAVIQRKLDTYAKCAELAFLGHNMMIQRGPLEDDLAFPTAYESFPKLRSWINNLGDYIDQRIIFLDDDSLEKFKILNRFVIQHLDQLATLGIPENDLGVQTRNLGRQHRTEIKRLTEDFVNHLRYEAVTRYTTK